MQFLLFYAIPFFAAIAFLASLTAFVQRPAVFYLRLLSLYLFIDSTVEAFTSYQALHRHNTQLINSLSSTVFFCFFIYILRVLINGRKVKRILLYCIIGLPVIFLVNIFLVQGSQVYQSITYSLGCLLIVAACIYYFWELFQNRNYINLVREPAFWICSGLLFYSTCSFPVYALLNFMNNISHAVVLDIVIIADLVYILLYLSFTIAFLCRLRPRKSI
jgi:hypothetical protein